MARRVAGNWALVQSLQVGANPARFLSEKKHGLLFRASEEVFEGMLHLYDWTLRGVLHAKFAVLVLSLGLIWATGYWFTRIPKGFIPDQDTNQIFGYTEAENLVRVLVRNEALGDAREPVTCS